MKKICFITAIPGSAYAFLRDHMAALRKEYRVYYVSNEPDEQKIVVEHDGYQCIDIQRRISLGKDLKALVRLTRYFRAEKFDAVHSVTPKAGLLTAIAGFFAGVPHRVHIFTGQVWACRKGPMRWLLKMMDRVIVLLGNHFLVDGEGQRQFLIRNRVLTDNNSRVLGDGSICGVNLSRYSPSENTRQMVREQLGIEPTKVVFAFMGRLNHDKGLYDLLPAFDRLASEREDVYLLLIGNDEEGVSSHFEEYTYLHATKNFCYYGPSNEPETTLQAADVFVLPTYREGFGTSVIEASALGLAVICSDVYGVKDAMVDNETGLRIRVGDVDSLYVAMKQMAEDPNLRFVLGKNGRARVVNHFDGTVMTRLWVDYYRELLG